MIYHRVYIHITSLYNNKFRLIGDKFSIPLTRACDSCRIYRYLGHPAGQHGICTMIIEKPMCFLIWISPTTIKRMKIKCKIKILSGVAYICIVEIDSHLTRDR